jgi:SLOG cluster2
VSTPDRPLAGCAVGVSISESDDSLTCGFPTEQVNRCIVQVVSALFGQGVAVVFGHDWREDGVMEAVHGFARQMQSTAPGREPLLQNILPWPDSPLLDETLRDQLSRALRVESAGLPEELKRFEAMTPADVRQLPERAYLRARALTHLRRRLEDRTHARICIGGRLQGSQGRYPGIVEEALFALTRRKPLYLVGLFGGATRQLIQAVSGSPPPPQFFAPAPIAGKYAQPSPTVAESSPDTADDRGIRSADEVWRLFRDTGIDGLSASNGLTPAENRELFDTPAIDSAIRLVLIGLSRAYRR